MNICLIHFIIFQTSSYITALFLFYYRKRGWWSSSFLRSNPHPPEIPQWLQLILNTESVGTKYPKTTKSELKLEHMKEPNHQTITEVKTRSTDWTELRLVIFCCVSWLLCSSSMFSRLNEPPTAAPMIKTNESLPVYLHSLCLSVSAPSHCLCLHSHLQPDLHCIHSFILCSSSLLHLSDLHLSHNWWSFCLSDCLSLPPFAQQLFIK